MWQYITPESLSVFNFKRRCTEWSVYDIKVPESGRGPMLSKGSHGTLMSHN